MSLREKIEHEIRERGPMPFSRYMEICLYDPAEGYYSRHVEQFGKAGDFYTSSNVHAVFGRLLAKKFNEWWCMLGQPSEIEILELGPGRGLFARDVLDWSRKKFPEFFSAARYTLQEASGALQKKLCVNLREHIESGKVEVVESSGGIAIRRTRGVTVPLIVFANEFFDALPVEIVSAQGKLHLSCENNRLQEIWLPAANAELEWLDRYGVHPEAGERVEVCLAAQKWMKEIAGAMERGFAVVVDYGYTRTEQLGGRHRGTLMAYRSHRASVNPYEAPGEQDLTAHVNFSALAAGTEGMQGEKLTTQSQFLLAIGEANEFADAFEDCKVPQERAKVMLQLKHLVTPAGMGETFQVLVASRGVGEVLQGNRQVIA